MKNRLRDREEGQIIPALLLVVVALIFLGLVFAQVGSAAEQKTQTQTLADSAAVAGAHRFRDNSIVVAGKMMVAPFNYTAAFNSVPTDPRPIPNAACDAARQNWNSNPHRNNAQLTCGNLSVGRIGPAYRVDVLAPRDQVVHGPINDSPSGPELENERARAKAVARVHLRDCPRNATFNPLQQAVADWVATQTMVVVGAPLGGMGCLDAGKIALLSKNLLNPGAAGLVGPPQPILTAVRNGLQVELVD